MQMIDLRCACGAPPIAVAPGDEPERAADLLTVDRGEPMRCWCERCWRQSWRKVA